MKLVSYDEEHITELPFKFDVVKLRKAYEEVEHLFTGHTQLSITHTAKKYKGQDLWREGCIPEFLQNKLTDEEFTEFNEELKNTYFYHVHKTLSTMYEVGRARLMMMRCKEVLTWHRDIQERIHVPIISNLGNKLVIMNKCYQLKEGRSYIVNTLLPHSAFNGGFDNRVTLVYHLRDIMYKPNAVTNVHKPMYKLKNKDTFEAAKELEKWAETVKLTPADEVGVNNYAEYIGINKKKSRQ